MTQEVGLHLHRELDLPVPDPLVQDLQEVNGIATFRLHHGHRDGIMILLQ